MARRTFQRFDIRHGALARGPFSVPSPEAERTLREVAFVLHAARRVREALNGDGRRRGVSYTYTERE